MHLSFPVRPSYEALVDRIEEKSTALDLEQVNFSIKQGEEVIGTDNWELLIINLAAIDLEVKCHNSIQS